MRRIKACHHPVSSHLRKERRHKCAPIIGRNGISCRVFGGVRCPCHVFLRSAHGFAGAASAACARLIKCQICRQCLAMSAASCRAAPDMAESHRAAARGIAAGRALIAENELLKIACEASCVNSEMSPRRAPVVCPAAPACPARRQPNLHRSLAPEGPKPK